jgi:hypothetical protein
MSRARPQADDYLKLFRIYGEDLGGIYQEDDEERYALLFEQVVRLLVRPSPFNLSLPEPFRLSARRYLDGHPSAVAHLAEPANRHFMLCDLHDLIRLKSSMARARETR